jgi:hypothetical protein
MSAKSLGVLVWMIAFPLAAADLLVLRDGTRKSGQLQNCVAETCRFATENVPVKISSGSVWTRSPRSTRPRWLDG